jgi:hypothetical protein
MAGGGRRTVTDEMVAMADRWGGHSCIYRVLHLGIAVKGE